MKRKGTLLAAAVLAFCLLTGCGSDAKTQEQMAAAEAEVTEESGTASEDTAANTIERVYLKEFNPADYVTPGEYTGLDISAGLMQVTDAYVDMYIEYLLANSPVTQEVTDRPVQMGDTVVIDYIGEIDDKAFEGGTAAGQTLVIGSGQYIEGFEEGLVGAQIGRKVDLNLKFPDDYGNADVAGKDVVFHVTVQSISTQTTPELNDEYVKSLGIENVGTVEEYRAYIWDQLEEDAQNSYQTELENAAMDAAMANAEYAEMPEKLVNYYKEVFEQNLTQQASMYGITLDQYLEMMASSGTFESQEASGILEELAVNSAKQSLLFSAIADAENISVTDEEVEQNMIEDAEEAGYATVEEYQEVIDLEAYKEYLRSEEVMDFLLDHANVTQEEEMNPAESVQDAVDTANEELDETEAAETDDAQTEEASDTESDGE